MSVENLTGQTLGPYELRELYGVGGMGAVYRSYQSNLKREVAVKVLPGGLAQQSGYVERFTREAEVAAALEHPNIVPIYDYGTQRNISYVVMRLLTGGSLSQRLQQAAERRQLPSIGEISDLLKQLAGALDYAHSRGVIHRDIKPSNVMFDTHGSAYLVDFGIAKLMDVTSGLTGTGMSLGTPAYMPPEQWRDEEITPAADQYALAVLVYAMLAGRLPFEASTPFALMHKHLNDIPMPPQTLRTELPPAINAVMERALAKTPQDRFPTVTAFAQAFDAATEGIKGKPTGFFQKPASRIAPPVPAAVPRISMPSATIPATTAPVPTAAPRRSPLIWLIVVALLLVIGVLVFLLVAPENLFNAPVSTPLPTSLGAAVTESASAESTSPTPLALATAEVTAGAQAVTEAVTESPTAVVVVPTDTLVPATEAPPAVVIVPTDTPAPATVEIIPVSSATPAPTATQPAADTATSTEAPSETPTSQPSDTPTVTATPTQNPTNTPAPTDTPVPTSTSAPTVQPSSTPQTALSPVTSLSLDFDESPPGSGWSSPEASAGDDTNSVVWMTERDATIEYPLEMDRGYDVKFRVLTEAVPGQMDSLTLSVNDRLIPLGFREDSQGGRIYEGKIPASFIEGATTRLTFHVDEVGSPDAQDSRSLGVQLDYLRIEARIETTPTPALTESPEETPRPLATATPLVSAETIEFDESINSTITNADGERWTFEGDADSRIMISLSSADIDTYLDLLSPDGSALATSDDEGGGTNSFINVTLPTSGTYTLVARAYDPSVTGAYTLYLTTFPQQSSSLSPDQVVRVIADADLIDGFRGELGDERAAQIIDLTGRDNMLLRLRLEGRYTDFVLHANFQWGPGSSEDSCGFSFREINDENYYIVEIDRDGKLWFAELFRGEWQPPNGISHDEINTQPGATNELLVIGLDDKIYAIINNQAFEMFTDDSMVGGQVALEAATLGGSDETRCIITDAWVWDLAE